MSLLFKKPTPVLLTHDGPFYLNTHIPTTCLYPHFEAELYPTRRQNILAQSQIVLMNVSPITIKSLLKWFYESFPLLPPVLSGCFPSSHWPFLNQSTFPSRRHEVYRKQVALSPFDVIALRGKRKAINKYSWDTGHLPGPTQSICLTEGLTGSSCAGSSEESTRLSAKHVPTFHTGNMWLLRT